MWCTHCRQDVPALAALDKQSLCCPRCGETICADSNDGVPFGPHSTADSAGGDSSASAATTDGELPGYDGWEMGEQLRDIARVLQTTKAKASQGDPFNASRFDLPHAAAPEWHAAAAGHPGKQRQAKHAGRGAAVGLLTWFALSLGTTGFVCGGILLGWSLWTDRQELWALGLPAALAGQIALLVGLVLQLDRLWHDSREAAAKLDNVDEQLHDLKAATTLLGASQGPAASVFYSHFAGGAGPQLLLSDLKGQLDLLAMKIAQNEQSYSIQPPPSTRSPW